MACRSAHSPLLKSTLSAPTLAAPPRCRGRVARLAAQDLLSSPAYLALRSPHRASGVWVIPDVGPPSSRRLDGRDRNACSRACRRSDRRLLAVRLGRLPISCTARYPVAERWRVLVIYVLLAVTVLAVMAHRSGRDVGVSTLRRAASCLHPAGRLAAFGLPVVNTVLWGGVLVTLVVATVGIVGSLPIGILLALGRRSKMPTVKLFSVFFIEFVRGVPLITVLFMASVMLPLFVPEELSPNKLLRALIGIALFASAYMAEVVARVSPRSRKASSRARWRSVLATGR